MKIVLIIAFIILVPTAMFCFWVFCKVASNSNDMAEQIEIERKLREENRKEKK